MQAVVKSAEIVQFPTREPSTFDQAWQCRAGMMKKRGDGSEKTRLRHRLFWDIVGCVTVATPNTQPI